jgi:hypothetical protein
MLQVGTLVLLLALAAFSLAACGDDEEETTTTLELTTTSELETTTSLTTGTTAAGVMGPFVIELSGAEAVPPVQTDATGTFTLEIGAGGADGATTTSSDVTGTTSASGTTDDDTTSTAGAGSGTTGGASGALGGMALQWTLEVENITDVTAAHIHLGATGENGDVLIPLYTGPVKEGEFSGTLAEGTLSLADIPVVQGMTPDQVFGAIQSGGTYVNVHTEQNPNGEIRGQIVFTPGGAGGVGGTTTTDVMGTDTTDDDDTTTSS